MYVLMILPLELYINVPDKCMPGFPKEIFYFKKYSCQNSGGNDTPLLWLLYITLCPLRFVNMSESFFLNEKFYEGSSTMGGHLDLLHL